MAYARIPPDVISFEEDQTEEGRDFIHFKHFFEVWDALNTLPNTAEVSLLEGFKRADWLKLFKSRLDGLRDLVVNLLQMQWLQPGVLGKHFICVCTLIETSVTCHYSS
jgi:hypothetical protein